MWWPSFVAVLYDLWRFCVSGTPVAPVQATGQPFGLMSGPADMIVRRPSTTVQLQPDVTYVATHETTQIIREKLDAYDSHLVQTGALTLREWLLYHVYSKRQSIPLLALQMTPIGSWHRTLKGLIGVTIGITPYTGSCMEWGIDPHSGNTAVVLEVTPAETITIGELGITTLGLYTKRTLTKSEWLELRPVFTTVQ